MRHDHVIVGGGIAGLALGAELAAHGSTLVLEAEAMPGTQATGRSAALYTPNFGPPLVRALNRASEPALAHPEPDFADVPLMRPRGALSVAAPGAERRLAVLAAEASPTHPIHPIDVAEALAMAPLLRPERVGAALFEPGVMDMDVDALQRACLRRLRARGGALVCGARVTRCERVDGGWSIGAGDLDVTARTVVNAAGAWAGELAALARATPVDLVPKRRTAIVVGVPAGLDLSAMPVVDFAGSDAYCKPDAGRLMASLGDQVPVPPHDVMPDELDVAATVDWLETETVVDVRTAPHAWAGLRTFTADGCPVVGFDPVAPDFFWLAGQGGYGIMMALSLARAACALIVDGRLPPELREAGVSEAALSPSRSGIGRGATRAGLDASDA